MQLQALDDMAMCTSYVYHIDNMLNGVSTNREMSINLMASIEANVLKSVGLCKCM